jgi:autotransporter-associated beta strand protein
VLDTPTLVWKGGAGNWDNTTANWMNGATPTTWSPGNIAAFGSPAGTVTVTEPVTVGTGIRFDTGGYTIAGAVANNITLSTAAGNAISVSNAADTATISARISGSVGLTKGGAGTLVLSGPNDFTGTVTIAGGVLAVASDAPLGAATNGIALNSGASGGTLRATTSFTVAASHAALTGSGGIDVATGSTLTFANPVAATALAIGSAGNTGTVVFAGPTVSFGGASVAAGAILRVTSPMSDLPTPAYVTLTSTGTIDLAGDNSAFVGGFQIGNSGNGPTVLLQSATALGTNQVRLNGGTIQAAIPMTVSNLWSIGGSSTFAGQPLELSGVIAFFGTGAKTLTVTNTTTISAAIVNTSGANNTLTKAGAGTLILSGSPNNYEGGTSVQNGILHVLDNSKLGLGNVTVSAASAAVTANVILQLDATNQIDDAADIFLISGAAGRRGQLFLNYPVGEPDTVHALTLDGFTLPPGLYTSANASGYITGTGSLLVTSIPEPSMAVLGLVGSGLLALRRRRSSYKRAGGAENRSEMEA